MVTLSPHPHRPPPRHRAPRHHVVLWVLAVLLVVAALALWQVTGSDDDPGTGDAATVPSATSTTAAPAASDQPTEASSPDGSPGSSEQSSESALEVTLEADRAAPMQPVALRGQVEGAPAGTEVEVQLFNGERWVPFPLRPVVDESGGFQTYVEVGERGVHRLRVREPVTGSTSDTLTIRIR